MNKKSNADLKNTQLQRKRDNNNTIAKIASLNDFDDRYTSKIKAEKEKLDNQIKDIQDKINEQRKKLKNAPNEQQTSEKVSKQIKAMENKLDKNFKEYNQAVAHNKQLRDKIDALRKERILFDKNL